MKKFLIYLENNDLSYDELNLLYQEIIKYYQEKLYIEDNLSGCKSLIKHQKELIDIEQCIIMNESLYTHCDALSYIQMLINTYDAVIKDKFSRFSKYEKMEIIKDYNLMNIYKSISDLESVCLIQNLDIRMKISNDKLSNSIRLINNLGLIEYDGEFIRPITKIKK